MSAYIREVKNVVFVYAAGYMTKGLLTRSVHLTVSVSGDLTVHVCRIDEERKVSVKLFLGT